MNIYVKLWKPNETNPEHPQLGIGWHRHGWKEYYFGFTVHFMFFKYDLAIDYVDTHHGYIKAHGNLLELDEIDFALWGMDDFRKIDKNKKDFRESLNRK